MVDFKSFVQAKTYKIIILFLVGIAVIFLAFNAGMAVGFRKAKFSYQWGENYHNNFTGPRGGMLRGAFRDFGGKDFIDSHGAAGQILKINDSEVVIKGQDGVEKIIIIKEDASIVRFRKAIKVSDLKVDEAIIIIGSPTSDGKIEAKFIRVLPESGVILPFKGLKPII